MNQSFYFYDLETSGFNPRQARIMQFGGQRTTLDLKPMDKPHNVYIKLTEDVLPDPDAILVTGITPQKTLAEGLSEAEFLRLFHQEVATPGTIFVGYNNVRFDDEFMRFLHYRNFYDAYEWQWQDGRSRWDLLDVVRMMRALRPAGITWPFDLSGKPSNRLEFLTSVNNISHYDAHDALGDVKAVMAVASMIRAQQPKLFDYLLRLRDKKAVTQLVQAGQPFIYTSGKYSSEWEKTTVVAMLAEHPRRGVLVFDLRNDPTDFIKLSPQQLAEAWQRRWDEPGRHLPVKTLQFNRCPAVAPLQVLDKASQKRLQLPLDHVMDNFAKLQSLDLAKPVLAALELMENARQSSMVIDELDADAQLYDAFVPKVDQPQMRLVAQANAEQLSQLQVVFHDDRLAALLPLYKARNFPSNLSTDDRRHWEQFRHRRLIGGKRESRLVKYFDRLAELQKRSGLTAQKRYLLEELELYGQSVMPSSDD